MGSLRCQRGSSLPLPANSAFEALSIYEKQLLTGASHPLKKGAQGWKNERGKEDKIMAIADPNGLPVSVFAESTTAHQATLAMSTLLPMVVPDAPQNLI